MGVTGIHAGEERFDEAVDDRRTDAVLDEASDGHVLDERRPDVLVRRPHDLLRGEDPRRGRRLGGDTHDRAAGQRLSPATAPDRGRYRVRMGEVGLEAQLRGQAGRLRTTGQHRLGADVHCVAGDLRAPELAAHDSGGLEDDDTNTVVLQQLPRGGQSGDAAADDGDGASGHGSTVAAEPLWNGPGPPECPHG